MPASVGEPRSGRGVVDQPGADPSPALTPALTVTPLHVLGAGGACLASGERASARLPSPRSRGPPSIHAPPDPPQGCW